MHVLKIGCRWEDCPQDYGPHKTVYNRFARGGVSEGFGKRYLKR